MDKTDEALMLEYKTGNLDALEEIFQRYKKRTLNYALRLLHHLADAEDVVSEAFYVLTSHKDRYEIKARFCTWFYTIVHNLCIDRIRKNRRLVFLWTAKNQEADCREIQIEDLRPLADETAEKQEMQTIVKTAVKRLPLMYRAAIVLREYQNLSYEEIAAILECSINKVKILIFRAREKLKKEILPLIQEANHV